MNAKRCSRRTVLQLGTLALLGCSGESKDSPALFGGSGGQAAGASGSGGSSGGAAGSAGSAGSAGANGGSGGQVVDNSSAVSIVRCAEYELTAVRAAMRQALDLIGGIRSLVSNKHVSIKLNLTGGGTEPVLGLHPGETYMTHESTAVALVSLLLEAGAKKVRLLESLGYGSLEDAMSGMGWDVARLKGLGAVEFENTRNLGSYTQYASVTVPDGMLYSKFELNRAYVETDVLVSLAKLKEHKTAGVTLATKNLFGVTPNSIYSGTPGENSITYRGVMHERTENPGVSLPGEIAGFEDRPAGYRVPRIITDLAKALPIGLSVIDAVRTVKGGEGPWHNSLTMFEPGLLLAGLNPICTDAVGASVLGYDPRGTFDTGDNHLLLAEQKGLGSADLEKIEVRGVSLADATADLG